MINIIRLFKCLPLAYMDLDEILREMRWKICIILSGACHQDNKWKQKYKTNKKISALESLKLWDGYLFIKIQIDQRQACTIPFVLLTASFPAHFPALLYLLPKRSFSITCCQPDLTVLFQNRSLKWDRKRCSWFLKFCWHHILRYWINILQIYFSWYPLFHDYGKHNYNHCAQQISVISINTNTQESPTPKKSLYGKEITSHKAQEMEKRVFQTT